MESAAQRTCETLQARYEALLAISESIVAHRQLSTLLRDLSRSLRPLIPFDGIVMTLVDANTRTARFYLLETDLPHSFEVGRVLPLDDTPGSVIFETNEPLYVPDLDLEDRFPAVNDMARSQGVLSYCLVPMATARGPIGGLNFCSLRKHAYSPDDIALMRQAARLVAVAVENTLNHEAAAAYQQELARERDRLRLLLDVNNAVIGELETRPLFDAISASLRNVMHVDLVTIALFDDQSQQLRRRFLDFPGSLGLIEEGAVLTMDSVPGMAFSTGAGVVFRRSDIDAAREPLFQPHIAEGLQWGCAVPLISRARTLGTLTVASRGGEVFSGDDMALLSQVGGQIAIALDNAFSYERIEELNAKLNQEKLYLEDEIRSEHRFEEIIGRSEPLAAVLRQVETVAPSDSAVLLHGETGTGKEVIARAIHHLSQRQNATFVKVNCAAIPGGLLESELFGHEKGAFTGAIAQRIGRFELANRGTLFLDEVGEIPLDLQPKLLRVLQEREFERLGSSRTIRVDARIVAATNRDLLQMVEERQFRADLYYRLNVFPITVPPLRDRPDDIPLLVRYFAQQCARRMKKQIDTIASETMEALVRYPWPGNVRELQNLVERAVILTSGPVLRVPLTDLKPPAEPLSRSAPTLEDVERQAILRALNEANWVIAGPQGAAARLGLKRSTLQFRMQKLGISRPKL